MRLLRYVVTPLKETISEQTHSGLQHVQPGTVALLLLPLRMHKSNCPHCYSMEVWWENSKLNLWCNQNLSTGVGTREQSSLQSLVLLSNHSCYHIQRSLFLKTVSCIERTVAMCSYQQKLPREDEERRPKDRLGRWLPRPESRT